MLARVAADEELGGETLRPQIVHQGGLYRVLVGPYDRYEADRLHSEARMLLFNRGVERRPGAVVQNMASWCPRLSDYSDDIRWCSNW